MFYSISGRYPSIKFWKTRNSPSLVVFVFRVFSGDRHIFWKLFGNFQICGKLPTIVRNTDFPTWLSPRFFHRLQPWSDSARTAIESKLNVLNNLRNWSFYPPWFSRRTEAKASTISFWFTPHRLAASFSHFLWQLTSHSVKIDSKWEFPCHSFAFFIHARFHSAMLCRKEKRLSSFWSFCWSEKLKIS